VAVGATVSVSGAVLQVFRVVGIGVGFGFAIGHGISIFIQRPDDPMVETTLTTIAAYAAFAGAEQVRGSGVIPTVVADLPCGNYGARTGMMPTTRLAVETFWEYIAFALNSIIFLLIGLEVHLLDTLVYWRLVLTAFLAVLVGRAAVVFGVSTLVARGEASIPCTCQAVLSWGGLRGGLSMAPLPKRLGVVRSARERVAYDRSRSELQAVQAALTELDQMQCTGQADRAGPDALRSEYETRLERTQRDLSELRSQCAGLRETDLR